VSVNHLLDRIFYKYKIYTAIQIGFDTTFFDQLKSRCNFLHVLDLNSDWSQKFLSDKSFSLDITLADSEMHMLSDLQYLDVEFDFVFLNKVQDPRIQKSLLDFFRTKKSGHIITNDTTFFYKIRDTSYSKFNLKIDDTSYTYYNLDFNI
jgi:hypothetical protein